MQSPRSTLTYATCVALLIFAIPSFAAAQTSSSVTAAQIQAQIQALLAEVAQLQAAIAASGGTTGTTPAYTAPAGGACPQIGRVLRKGQSGDDVTRLQQFLAADPSIYPEAQVTGYYGALTEAAVQRWQAKHNIVSSGDPDSTGYGMVGPRTAAAIALQCGGSSGTTPGTFIPRDQGQTGPAVGGFVEVTPITGAAPLTVNVIATVNTVSSCDAVTYVLDWGDGTVQTALPVPAGACRQMQQTYSHVYVYGGVYTIRLSAGQHSTTATVQVSGPARAN